MLISIVVYSPSADKDVTPYLSVIGQSFPSDGFFLDDPSEYPGYKQRRSRMGMMSREIFPICKDSICTLLAAVVSKCGNWTGLEPGSAVLELGEYVLAEAKLYRPGETAPPSLSTTKHAFLLSTPPTRASVSDLFVAEWHLFNAFLLESTMAVRMRLAVLLCGLYARMGYSDYLFVAMGLLHRVGCLLHCRANLRESVQLNGGRVLAPTDLTGAWGDVLVAFQCIRDSFLRYSPQPPPGCFAPLAPVPKRRRASKLSVRGVERAAASYDPPGETMEEVD